MTASNVLVVRVPRPIEDLDACVEHIKRGLRDGILILGADVSYRVERFPPLGAVEVVDADKLEPIAPVVVGGPSPTPPTGGSGGNGDKLATKESVAMALEQFGKVRVVMVTDGRGK